MRNYRAQPVLMGKGLRLDCWTVGEAKDFARQQAQQTGVPYAVVRISPRRQTVICTFRGAK